jgi:hypothetical protein
MTPTRGWMSLVFLWIRSTPEPTWTSELVAASKTTSLLVASLGAPMKS